MAGPDLAGGLAGGGTQGTLPVARMEAALQAASALRRAAQQGVKGVQRLAGQEGTDADAGDG